MLQVNRSKKRRFFSLKECGAEHRECVQIIKDGWRSILEGESVLHIAQKIAYVSEHLTFWNRDRFRKIGQ